MRVRESIIGVLLVLQTTGCRHQKSPDDPPAGDSSTTPAGAGDRRGRPCTKEADCEPDLRCAYAESGCDHPARTCEPWGSCTRAVYACSCDGQDIDICPSTSKPYATRGRCNGEDKPCSSDAECKPGLKCAYEPGCAPPKGTCQLASRRSCATGLKVKACGCDGKEFDICEDPFHPHKSVGVCPKAPLGEPCSTKADCRIGDCAYVQAGCDHPARLCQLVGSGCPRSLTLCGCDGKDMEMCLSDLDSPSPPFAHSGAPRPFTHVGNCSEKATK
jgi:hypothetical protein